MGIVGWLIGIVSFVWFMKPDKYDHKVESEAYEDWLKKEYGIEFYNKYIK